ASLTFTPADWNVPQSVAVTGGDDAVDDGDAAYDVVTAPAASADPAYAGMDAADVSVLNTDDDTAGIQVTPTAGLVTTEAGGAADFAVVLASQPVADVVIAVSSSNPAEGAVSAASLTFTPAADVVIPVASSDASEGGVSAASLTFTPADWNVAQTITATGMDDFEVDGDIAYTIRLEPAASTDPNYGGRDAADLAATNTDDDVAGITVTPVSGLVTTEAGGAASFTVRLTSQPTADVVIPVASSNPAEGAVSAASLTFTAADWNVPQTVTVTGVDDHVQDGA